MSLSVSLYYPATAHCAAAVVFEEDIGATFERSTLRLLGTVFGAFTGAIVLYISLALAAWSDVAERVYLAAAIFFWYGAMAYVVSLSGMVVDSIVFVT